MSDTWETQPHELDHVRADAFAERMFGVLNDGALALLTSVGQRTGLFDVKATLPPSTSQALAGAASLNERYVREWLGAMVTGQIGAYDAAKGSYQLPPEHAASLTRASTPNNTAACFQYISLLG
ncbi:MAG TPA: hypothetical protein VGP82_17680 [Ktedonobacterales bacterium]|nr:hypothetical protein [Ktedonobacterales bacterium]